MGLDLCCRESHDSLRFVSPYLYTLYTEPTRKQDWRIKKTGTLPPLKRLILLKRRSSFAGLKKRSKTRDLFFYIFLLVGWFLEKQWFVLTVDMSWDRLVKLVKRVPQRLLLLYYTKELRLLLDIPRWMLFLFESVWFVKLILDFFFFTFVSESVWFALPKINFDFLSVFSRCNEVTHNIFDSFFFFFLGLIS